MTDNFTEKEKNSTVYVVLIDDEPRFYSTDIEEARKKMVKIITPCKYSPLYRNCYLFEKNENEIKVFGFNKYSIIDVDQLIHTGKVVPIEECEHSSSSEEELSDSDDETEKPKSSWWFW